MNNEISTLQFYDATTTTPPDKVFVLVLCPSGYNTIKNVIVTARKFKEYRGDAWIDHSNDLLTDSGLVPTYWAYIPWVHLD